MAAFRGSFALSRVVEWTTVLRPLRSAVCISCSRGIQTAYSRSKNQHDKFSTREKKKRFRRTDSLSNNQKITRSGQLKQFQLDPLKGVHAPPNTESIRQQAVAETLRLAVEQVLDSSDMNTELSECDIEITKVQIAKDYGHATVYWISDSNKNNDEHVQTLLDNSRDHIQKLLPSYHNLYRTPQLVFTRDKETQYMTDLNELLDNHEI